MITIITGAPGTGKSALLVSLLASLGKDRALYVNGIPDLTFDHLPLSDADVINWPSTVPDGSCVVVDEVQRHWRPRGPGSKVPLEIQAFETHRHRGLDFYFITQKPGLIDKNIRDLTGRHIHLRDLGMLGRWFYEWPECADQCSTTWRTAPLKKRYRLPKAIFKSYKSASEHVKPVRSVPWMLGVMVLALIVTAVLVFQAYKMISARMSPVPDKAISEKMATAPNLALPPSGPRTVVEPSGYDFTSFVPRVASKPETAPAYDGLRQVVVMPMVVGGYCDGSQCHCVNQQGTDSGLTDDDCRQWLKSPPFNPYRLADTHHQNNDRYASGKPAPIPSPSPVQAAVASM